MILDNGKSRVIVGNAGTGISLSTQFQCGAGVTTILTPDMAMQIAGELIRHARKMRGR